MTPQTEDPIFSQRSEAALRAAAAECRRTRRYYRFGGIAALVYGGLCVLVNAAGQGELALLGLLAGGIVAGVGILHLSRAHRLGEREIEAGN